MLASILFLFGTITMWAQSGINDISAEVNADDATITDLRHATISIKREFVTDSLTQFTDTIEQVSGIEWNTQVGTAKRRMARRRAASVEGSDFDEKDSNWYFDIWWFNYNYPSINANGEPIVLSGQCCMPDEGCDSINNIIIGCHVTITSNRQCPSRYSAEGDYDSDVGMLMNMAGSGLWLDEPGNSRPFYNLVIMPDYEGYGTTRSNAHPYLYQELTARQVVDAVRYGKALYESSSQVEEVRHPFRTGWRSIPIGYSQGGSVALATHRFIEQNGLTDELHLSGSICGDGPYDLLSTLMYYVGRDIAGYTMSMPVVLPLILKGMCDSNPYMKSHQVSDYLSAHFLETGIIDWLTAKEKSTDDITEAWISLYENGKDGNPNYYRDILTSEGKAKLVDLLTEQGYAYFKALYNANKDTYTSASGIPLPAHRGLMEDLHIALESNNMLMGWQPQHPIILYHSYNDTVVPEKNRERAGNTIGDWIVKAKASGKDHVDEGSDFYFYDDHKMRYYINKLAKCKIHPTAGDISTFKAEFLRMYQD